MGTATKHFVPLKDTGRCRPMSYDTMSYDVGRSVSTALSRKTRGMGLLLGENYTIQPFLTDHLCNRQTDGRVTAYSALCMLPRAKNRRTSWNTFGRNGGNRPPTTAGLNVDRNTDTEPPGGPIRLHGVDRSSPTNIVMPRNYKLNQEDYRYDCDNTIEKRPALCQRITDKQLTGNC